MSLIALIRGGGDLASGVALRLYRAGLKVIITELPQPLVVRRLVSFAEAVYRGEFSVEGVTARKVDTLSNALECLDQEELPVLIDPDCQVLDSLGTLEVSLRSPFRQTPLTALVDARMTKRAPEISLEKASLIVGLGPGFIGGVNCHAAIETNRGHFLGRVIWRGSPEPDTGVPEGVGDRRAERVLRAPAGGLFHAEAEIGARLDAGQSIGSVNGLPILAPFSGVLRGVLHSEIQVTSGLKVGDIDPRNDPRFATLVSDKSLAVGGGVLEAILSRTDLRPHLWE